MIKYNTVSIQVMANAKQLCKGLKAHGYKIATGDTEVHLVLVDVRSAGLTGAKAEYILEEVNIACNKNTGNVFTSRLLSFFIIVIVRIVV